MAGSGGDSKGVARGRGGGIAGESDKQVILRLATRAGWTGRDYGYFIEANRGDDFIYVIFHGEELVTASVRYGSIFGVASLAVVLEYLQRRAW